MSLTSSHTTDQESIRKPPHYILLYVAYSEIFGHEPTQTDLLKQIRKYKLIDLIELLAKINMVLENDGAFEPKLQEQLTRELFPETTIRKIFELLQQDGRIVFGEQQLLSLMKRIFIDGYVQAKNTLEYPNAVRDFTPCYLMISDLISQVYLKRINLASTDEEKEKQQRIILVQLLSFHATEVSSNLIGRYYQLFFQIPRMPQLRQSPNFIDLNEIFKKATSFDLEQYFSLGFAILTHFASCSLLKGELKPKDIYIEKTPYFSKTSVKESEAKRILDELSLNVRGFRKAFKDEEKTAPGSYYSFVPIRQKPLLRVSDEMVIPLSVRFLKEKITKGIYWTIHDYLPKEDRTRFTNFFGKEIFQYYVESIFRRIYPERDGLAKRAFFDFKYGKPERSSSDVIIISPIETYHKSQQYDAVFIEVVSSRLKMKDTLTIGDYDAFVGDLEKIVIGKAGQLDGRIKDFKAGKFSLDNISATEIRTYYPVIVTIESLPQVPGIWNEIEEKLKANDYLQAADIQRLQVLDIEDIEILESLLTQGVSLTEILREKNKDIEGRDLIFKHYLSKSRFGELKLDNEFLLGEVNELGNKVKTLLFPGDSQ